MSHEQLPDPEPEDAPETGAFGELLREVAAAPRLPPELMKTLTFDAAKGMLPSSPALGRGLPSLGDVVDGRYRIDAELGRGGMGVVFRAHNARTGRDVALKWMLPRGLSRSASERSDSVERFVREARAVSRIDHPNVVRVLDVGGDPDMPYLVMECLTGETLRERLRRGTLTWDEAMAIVSSVMHGVGAAHRAGVVHRDLKPDNIFLTAGTVKVLDFGVSRIGDGEDHTTLTRTGTMLGTPAYMPLEQLRGSREIDARTDVYALGVILFEALSGRLPYEAQTAADQAVLLATRDPDALVDLVPGLKGPRADAVMKALARKPADRYASVEAFQSALANAAVGSRSRVGVAAASLLLLCAIVFWLWLAPSQTPARPAAVLAPPPAVDVPKVVEVPAKAVEAKSAPTPAAPPEAPVMGTSFKPVPDPKRARRLPAAAQPAKENQVGPNQPTSEAPTALSVEHFKATDAKPSEPGQAAPVPKPPRPTPSLNPTEF